MGLRKTATTKGKQTARAVMTIGVIAKITLDAGVVAKFAKAIDKPATYVSYSKFEKESEVRAECVTLAEQVMGEDGQRVMPSLALVVMADTALTPTKMKANFISLEKPDAKYPQTLKRQGDFMLDHMSDEIDDLGGKPFWAHIQWVRLPEGEYGGDYALTGDDAANELAMLVTYLPSKKGALTLAESLRDGKITLDDLAAKSGFDRGEYGRSQKGRKPKVAVKLTVLGPITAKAHVKLENFLSDETVSFLAEAFKKNNGDVEKTAVECGANPGDLAIVMGDKEYFTTLMAATGKGEQEALAVVANDLEVQIPDLASFLGVKEPAF